MTREELKVFELKADHWAALGFDEVARIYRACIEGAIEENYVTGWCDALDGEGNVGFDPAFFQCALTGKGGEEYSHD